MIRIRNRAYSKKYYQKNKQRIIKRNYERICAIIVWFHNMKKAMLCKTCGESDWRCLDFHHTDSHNKKYDIAEIVGSGYSKRKILAEIAKCDVLCSNCHRKLYGRWSRFKE